MNKEREEYIKKVCKAMELSGAYTRIAEALKDVPQIDYQLVVRTLSGKIKRWDERHDKVIEQAEKELKSKGVELIK